MSSPKAHAVSWSALDTDHPMPLIERQRFVGEHMMISRVLLSKGFSVPTHEHANEQFAVVLSGAIRFDLGDADDPTSESTTLGPGDVLVIPPNAPHAATAIEDTLILDCFSPTSETTGVDRNA
ncbi:MAG: cupin domain-containing protein [Phycisphaerales bacterium]|nr:cupin domain-containing protein [Phycisphaerales bacterium]